MSRKRPRRSSHRADDISVVFIEKFDILNEKYEKKMRLSATDQAKARKLLSYIKAYRKKNDVVPYMIDIMENQIKMEFLGKPYKPVINPKRRVKIKTKRSK